MAAIDHHDDPQEQTGSRQVSAPQPSYSWDRLAPHQKREVLKMVTSQSSRYRRRLILLMTVLLIALLVVIAFYMTTIR
jgi:hypothetical protein